METVKKSKKIFLIVVLSFIASINVYAETYEYDSLDRVVKVTYDDGSYVTYDYDAAGNMVSTKVVEPEKKEDSLSDRIGNVINNIINTIKEKVIDFFRKLFG